MPLTSKKILTTAEEVIDFRHAIAQPTTGQLSTLRLDLGERCETNLTVLAGNSVGSIITAEKGGHFPQMKGSSQTVIPNQKEAKLDVDTSEPATRGIDYGPK